jgi:hypothetical protein
VSTSVAIVSIACHTAIWLAGIHYGVKGLALVLPQLRVQAPPKVPEAGAAAAASTSEVKS